MDTEFESIVVPPFGHSIGNEAILLPAGGMSSSGTRGFPAWTAKGGVRIRAEL